ncbi:hypothetical protein HK102_008428, partial [Quaeritorhiza haematococci]
MSEGALESPLIPPASSQASAVDPQTGQAALQHFNRPEHADIILDVEGAGIFYAHRSYLKRSERFKAYSEETFMEGSAPLVKITAPVPNQFFDVLWHLYTEELLPRWFGADQLAETFCSADYFMLDKVKKEAIKSFPSVWEDVVCADSFGPEWISLELVTELISSEDIEAVDKLRILGNWFSRGDDLSADASVFEFVDSEIEGDESVTPASLLQLRKDLGRTVFDGIIPSS